MIEKFTYFLWNFPILIEHENHGDPQKIHRYSIGLQRISLLRRLADPFAFGPTERARETGEMVYAFLIPVTDDTSSPDIPDDIQYEYLAGSITDRHQIKLFAYMWFKSLAEAKDYVTKKGMKLIGGWNEKS